MKDEMIDRRIGELENELFALRRRKIVLLQEELQKLQSGLGSAGAAVGSVKTGKRGRPAKANNTRVAPSASDADAPASSGRRTRKRGKKISDEEAVDRLRKIVISAGSEGVSARAAAIEAKVLYPRAMKLMTASFVKSGSGKWTRYTIK